MWAKIKDIKLLVLLLVLICFKESCHGIFQLLGLCSSNHNRFAITGSFLNPGPYGGFLAVCTSILIAYRIINKNAINNRSIKLFSNRVVSVVAITAIVVLPSTQSRSATLALGCSMILLAFRTYSFKNKIKPILKKYGQWLLMSAIIIGFVAYLYKKPSADGRLFVDKICIKAMYENGWKGAGHGHFGRAYGEAQANYFKKQIDEKGKDDLDWKVINEHDRISAGCPDNAFNEYLFVGVEAGAFALLLFIGTIITAIVISFKRGTIWCYGLTAFAVFALFSYPLHVKQFQIMLPILLVTCVSDRRQHIPEQNNKTKAKKQKDINNLFIIALLLFSIVTISTFFAINLHKVRVNKKMERYWKKVERWHKMEYYEYVIEDCDTLFSYMKNNYHFLFVYGQSLNKTGNYEKSDSILLMGTTISSDPMFWNILGNNSLAMGKYREAEACYKHAFYMVPNRLYPLNLLAKLYYIEGDTLRFLEMAEIVESFKPKVESANTERLRAEIRELKEDNKSVYENNEKNPL